MSGLQRKDIPDSLILQAVEDGTIWDLPFPAKLISAKVMHLSDRGLVEYGVSINYPWLTEEGRSALLAQTRHNPAIIGSID